MNRIIVGAVTVLGLNGCAISHDSRPDIAPHIGKSFLTTRDWVVCDVRATISKEATPHLVAIQNAAGDCTIRYGEIPARTPITLRHVSERTGLGTAGGLNVYGTVSLPRFPNFTVVIYQATWSIPPWW